MIDDGWPAAPNWDVRQAAAEERIEAAARRGQLVGLVAASEAGARSASPMRRMRSSGCGRSSLCLMSRIAWRWSRRSPSCSAPSPKTEVVWIADGLARGHAREFAQKLAALAPHVDAGDGRALGARARRAREPERSAAGSGAARGSGGPAQGIVRALDLKGLAIGETRFEFPKGALEAQSEFRSARRICATRSPGSKSSIEHSAGAVSLLDARWKRRTVGIVSDETADVSLPLLAPNYYLRKALAPFADVREVRPGTPDPIAVLLDQHPAVMILADVGTLSDTDHALLTQFVEEGGLLLRFAGARLAAASDDLVPVRLRRGGRVLGSALSWETPKKLAPFEAQSPFVGLKVPGEVTVRRQVLAEPDAGRAGKDLGAARRRHAAGDRRT